MAKGVFRRCSCGMRLPDGTRTCPRPGCPGTVGWAYTVEVGRLGERKTRYCSGFKTAAEASTARARVLTELQDGLFTPPSKLTLGEYLDRWLANGPARGWKPNTARDYRVGVAHIKRYLADARLQELTRDQIQRFYATLLREGKLPRRTGGERGPLAPKTVANVHIVLRAALENALAETPPLRRGNPAHDAYHYSRESAGRELQHWTLDEMRAFLAHIAAFETGAWSMRDAGMWAVDLGTGLRRGELLGLRRRDLDLRNARLHVRQQWTKDGANGRAMVTLKTGQKAWRTVDLDRDTVALLEMQLAMIDAERKQWGSAYLDQGLVFSREDGLPQDPDEVTRRFKRAALAAPGVPEIVFHGMRHTHATLLLEDGVSLKVVAERLGDREDTVLKLYGHITPRGRVVAVASVGTWWREEGGTGPSAEVTVLHATIARLEAELAALREGLPASREQSVSETPTQSNVEAE